MKRLGSVLSSSAVILAGGMPGSCSSTTSSLRRSFSAPAGGSERPSTLRVAVAQLTSTSDQTANYEAVAKLAAEASAVGAKFLALPECFHFIGSAAAETIAQSEGLEGPSMTRYRSLASQHKLWLSCGGFHERVEVSSPTGPETKVYNSHVLISPGGDIAAVYRKLHLFDVDIPNGPVLMESRSTVPGEELVLCDTGSAAGVLGLTTCYDMRFPELYTILTARGAQVLLAPSAFTVPTGRAHWETLLRSRAIENQWWDL